MIIYKEINMIEEKKILRVWCPDISQWRMYTLYSSYSDIDTYKKLCNQLYITTEHYWVPYYAIEAASAPPIEINFLGFLNWPLGIPHTLLESYQYSAVHRRQPDLGLGRFRSRPAHHRHGPARGAQPL